MNLKKHKCPFGLRDRQNKATGLGSQHRGEGQPRSCLLLPPFRPQHACLVSARARMDGQQNSFAKRSCRKERKKVFPPSSSCWAARVASLVGGGSVIMLTLIISDIFNYHERHAGVLVSAQNRGFCFPPEERRGDVGWEKCHFHISFPSFSRFWSLVDNFFHSSSKSGDEEEREKNGKDVCVRERKRESRT